MGSGKQHTPDFEVVQVINEPSVDQPSHIIMITGSKQQQQQQISRCLLSVLFLLLHCMSRNPQKGNEQSKHLLTINQNQGNSCWLGKAQTPSLEHVPYTKVQIHRP